MKINSQALQAYSRPAIASTANNQAAGKSAAPTATHSPQAPQDEAAQLSVSPEARALAAKSSAPVNQEKVGALRQQIADGKFVVNTQMLAMRLLDKLA